jgi:hypothetical protein
MRTAARRALDGRGQALRSSGKAKILLQSAARREEESIMANPRLLVLVAFAVGASCLYAAEEKEKVTLEGTLVSSACYLGSGSHPTGDEMGGVKHCGSTCLKQGKPAGLLTKEKQFHILVAPSLLLAPYVGQEVRVTGIDHNGAISVEKAEAKKDGGWEEINLKSSMPGREDKPS